MPEATISEVTQSPRTLIVSLDGTSNSPETAEKFGKTNPQIVSELLAVSYPNFDAIMKQKLSDETLNIKEQNLAEGWRISQAPQSNIIVYYDRGVGSPAVANEPPGAYYLGKLSRTAWRKISEKVWELRGLLFARGISANIEQAYRFLAENYKPGDRIIITGFSRGAFTAYTLANVLGHIGLINKAALGDSETLSAKIKEGLAACKNAKTCGVEARSFRDKYSYPQLNLNDGTTGKVDLFLALFDIVKGPVLDEIYEDRRLTPLVTTLFDVRASDEHRPQYADYKFYSTSRTQEVKPWCIGSHCNVGGGLSDQNLSNIPLYDLLKALQKNGIPVNETFLNQLEANLTKPRKEYIYESWRKPVRKWLRYNWLNFNKKFRREIGGTSPNETVHQTAIDLHKEDPQGYKPSKLIWLMTAKEILSNDERREVRLSIDETDDEIHDHDHTESQVHPSMEENQTPKNALTL